jgi:hypothetical protein
MHKHRSHTNRKLKERPDGWNLKTLFIEEREIEGTGNFTREVNYF